jgi:hypothetical protein
MAYLKNEIDLSPREIRRDFDFKQRIKEVAPIPFDKRRAYVIAEIKDIEGFIIHARMSDGEIAFVDAVWEKLDGEATWQDAFKLILEGKVFL